MFLSQTISARTFFFPHTRNTRSSTPLIPAHPPRFETFYASKVSLHHKEMLQRSTAQRSAVQDLYRTFSPNTDLYHENI